MHTYKFHWRDGKTETGKGIDASNALTALGYGGGAIAALDYYELIEPHDLPSRDS